jgi:hypothetical protein
MVASFQEALFMPRRRRTHGRFMTAPLANSDFDKIALNTANQYGDGNDDLYVLIFYSKHQVLP